MPNFIEQKRQQIVRFIQERQTTIASGLAALLIIVAGFLIFNFFLRVNKESSTSTTGTTTQEATATGEVAISPTNTPTPTVTTTTTATPTPSATATPKPSNAQGQVSPQGAASTNKPQQYTVQRGDNLGTISQKFYNNATHWTDIAKANKLVNPSLIFAGNVLTIPQVETGTVANATPAVTQTPATGISSGGNVEYIVSHGDTLWQIAESFYGSGFEWYQIKDANPSVGTLPDGRPLIFNGQHLVIP